MATLDAAWVFIPTKHEKVFFPSSLGPERILLLKDKVNITARGFLESCQLLNKTNDNDLDNKAEK